VFCLSFYLLNYTFATTTPTGSPTKVQETVGYIGDFASVVHDYFSEQDVQLLRFRENSQGFVSGENHEKTGVGTCGTNVKEKQLFIMQKRKKIYVDTPPLLDCDLAEKGMLFSEKLQQADKVLSKQGVVPLLERFVQKGTDGQEFYVEVYPLIVGADGEICIRRLIGFPEHTQILQDVIFKMGIQTAKMFLDYSPHPDCHPANFLVDMANNVWAIDCRGPYRKEEGSGKTYEPAYLFVQILSEIIQKRLLENTSESTDFKALNQNYQRTFELCRQAFIGGIEKGLEKYEASRFLLSGLFLDRAQILNKTQYLERKELKQKKERHTKWDSDDD